MIEISLDTNLQFTLLTATKMPSIGRVHEFCSGIHKEGAL